MLPALRPSKTTAEIAAVRAGALDVIRGRRRDLHHHTGHERLAAVQRNAHVLHEGAFDARRAAAPGVTFGKSRTSRRGRSSDSVSDEGIEAAVAGQRDGRRRRACDSRGPFRAASRALRRSPPPTSDERSAGAGTGSASGTRGASGSSSSADDVAGAADLVGRWRREGDAHARELAAVGRSGLLEGDAGDGTMPRSAATWLAASATRTLRRSTSRVSRSGRLTA